MLKFKSAKQLWEFKQSIQAHEAEVDLSRCIIICECSKEQVALALERFGAEVLPNPP